MEKKRKVTNVKKTPKIVKEKKNTSKEKLPEEINPREKYMTIGDHLEELRKKIFYVIGVWLFFSLIVGIFIEKIHIFLVQPFKEVSNYQLILGTIYGPLEIYFKLAIVIGVLISLPINLNILWSYITPALSEKTAIIGHVVIFISSILFWLGVAFGWFYLFPFSLKMMLESFLPAETIAQTTVEKYYSFLFMILIGTGISFQLPLLIVSLGSIGLVTLEWHKKKWKFIIILVFLLSAFITPPDPLSMFVMAFPLLFLYFFSVGIVWLIEKRRNN